MQTRPVRDGADWAITGSRQWISWAGKVDFFIVIAVTDVDVPLRAGALDFLPAAGGTQAVQFMIADSVMEIEAARRLVYHAAGCLTPG